MYAETAVTDISPISVCFSGCSVGGRRRHKPIVRYRKISSQYLVGTESGLAVAFFVPYFLSVRIIVSWRNGCFY